MITNEQIQKLVQKAIKSTDLFIVDVNVKPGNSIVVTIDSAHGVAIADCVKVSRFIENSLDRDEEDFALEVTSAGLDRPFKVLQQYQINVGKEVKVLCTDGTIYKWVMQEVKQDSVMIVSEKKDKKTKQVIQQQVEVEYKNIKETKLKIKI